MPTSSSCDLFISACEASADAHAAPVIKQLTSMDPSIQIEAIAGPKMREEKISSFLKMEEFEVMGFFDILSSLPSLIALFQKVKKRILKTAPKAILCIDYPEFHMLLESSLKKAGYEGKIFHYVAPSVWAWRQKRADKLANISDHLFTIFPFEEAYFSHTSLKTTYVGNPLIETIPSLGQSKKTKEKILAIFPGSRKKEIERNLSLQLKAAEKLKKKYALQVMSSFPSSLHPSNLPNWVQLIPNEEKYLLMQRATLALATSGTVNLELALHQTPTIVTYAISPLDLFLAKHIFRIRLPFYSIVNILLQKSIFPELFGPHLTEENIYYYADRLLQNDSIYATCQRSCKEIIELLGEKKASQEVAKGLFCSLK